MQMFEELEKDFKTLVDRINFERYDPLDPNFMKAAVIALMWFAGRKILGEDDISDELEDAEKYMMMYMETSDAQYKDMAGDEARHAGILIKKRLAGAVDEKERERLNGLEKKRQEMMRAISTATVPLKPVA